MEMDQKELRSLLDFLSTSDIQEFKLEGDDFRLEVRRNLPSLAAPAAAAQIAMAAVATPAIPSNAASAVAPAIPPPAAPASRNDLVEVKAPGEAAFVEIGSRVNVGQTICILEAMKLMNELEAEQSGEVVEILVANGMPVEYNQVLMLLRPA
jgi:acetyl-CoA carboxylase biotin carboxyl carrier protein